VLNAIPDNSTHGLIHIGRCYDISNLGAIVWNIDGNIGPDPHLTRSCTCWVQILDAPIDLRLLEKEAVRWHQR
jgi:hypothetical protein